MAEVGNKQDSHTHWASEGFTEACTESVHYIMPGLHGYHKMQPSDAVSTHLLHESSGHL